MRQTYKKLVSVFAILILIGTVIIVNAKENNSRQSITINQTENEKIIKTTNVDTNLIPKYGPFSKGFSIPKTNDSKKANQSDFEDKEIRTILETPIPFGEAVDYKYTNWYTWGYANWFGESDISYYGNDAAMSGDISHGQYTGIETMVIGPGTLSFYWKVSSEQNWDYLNFYVDGYFKGRISGDVNWQKKAYDIGPGPHWLEWVYSKDNSVTTGFDAGWIDKVTFLNPYDDFDDNSINTAKWSVSVFGSGPFAREANNRLEINVPYYSSGLSGFGAGYQSKCRLRGDFDIRLDYNLINWPNNNGVRLGVIFEPGKSIERSSISGRERYILYFGKIVGQTDTNHFSGKLRLVRTNNEINGYYYTGSDWEFLGSTNMDKKDFSFYIGTWSFDNDFADRDVKVGIDNFVINYGQLVCP